MVSEEGAEGTGVNPTCRRRPGRHEDARPRGLVGPPGDRGEGCAGYGQSAEAFRGRRERFWLGCSRNAQVSPRRNCWMALADTPSCSAQ